MGKNGTKTGTVKWFNATKGFGFLSVEDSETDIFAHYQNILGEGYKTLEAGETVEFELDSGPKGAFAKNITRLGVKA